MAEPHDEVSELLERLHDLDADRRAILVAEQSAPLARALARLISGPEPRAAIQRALSLPPRHQAGLGEIAADLLHQGSYPARLMRLLEADLVAAQLADDGPLRRPELAEELAEAVAAHGAAEGIARVRTLRYLALARRELEHAPLEEVGAGLSDLAGACIDAAMDSADPSLREGVAVFGMGKLGGRELNFLSDIDLVFVHLDELTSGPDERTAHRRRNQLHTQLRSVVRLLEGSGVWRPVFHVDLRLRPFGSRGPLSSSLAALERYYERHGRSWERQAWLRARVVAGSRELGEEVLARLEPFVWRRSFGPEVFQAITDMMKRSRIQAHRSVGRAAVDLKHDAGGIREIEFFVQGLQLLNGGRHPSVRSRSTLRALDRLAASGFVSDREHEILAGAYRVLRRLEHRVQLVEGQQTHRLPEDPQARELLARRLAMRAPPTWLASDELAEVHERPRSLQGFDQAVTTLRRQVQAITGTLTGESELGKGEAEELELARAVILDAGASHRARVDALDTLGVWPAAIEEVAAMIEHLHSRELGALAASGAAQVGAQKLLSACLDSANPVEAVRRLVEFASQRPAHLGVWRVMAEPEHEPLVRQVADLFGTSEPLSRGLIDYPDRGPSTSGDSGPGRDGGLSLLLEAAASELPTAEELRARFAETIRDPGDTGEQLVERLSWFKHRELVCIGLHDLARRPDPLAVGRALSDVADLVVRELLADLAQSYSDGDASAFVLAIFALGKFGMQAMDYGSDLDLMFVFEPEGAVMPTVARGAAQRVSRRLIARLEHRVRGSRLYEVDMRLRPSGRQGLLVSSLDGFRAYHARELEVWERLALVRLRAVAELRFDPARPPAQQLDGRAAMPGALSRIVTDEVVPASVWRSDDGAEIAAQTRRLKQRIEEEVARETRDTWDVKSGVGGCLELELLVAALQLHADSACAEHELRVRDIPTALARLAACGVLDAAEAQQLDGAYRFLRLLLNRLRMTRGSGWGEGDRLTVNSPRLISLARRMGLADREALVSTLERQRAIVRATFDRHLSLDHGGAN